MKRFYNSLLGAILIFIFIVVLLIVSYPTRGEWWQFIDIFFAFMWAFCHMMSIMLAKMSAIASRKLETISSVCVLLFLVSWLVLWFVK